MNRSNDYYAKLSRMFNITTITSTNLKPWLDPSGNRRHHRQRPRSICLQSFQVRHPQEHACLRPGHDRQLLVTRDGAIPPVIILTV
ncbi:MAG: hypothetical protein MZV63_08105 [Marinilabiliales bacterium]|nr:hypothetical protein [Marinilabiliales bacterium]